MSLSTLSLLIGAVVPQTVPVDIIDALERVEIDSAIGERSSFRLTFRLGDPSLPERFLSGSADLLRVVVVLNQTDVPSVMIDGVLTVHTLATTDNGVASLVVSGEDLTLLMDLVEIEQPLPPTPVQARVLLLLAKYGSVGIVPFVVPPPLMSTPLGGATILQQGTDYRYIRSLADAIGFRFTLDPGPTPTTSIAYWGPEPHGDRLHPALSIDWARPDPVSRLELSFDATHRVLPEAVVIAPGSGAAIPIPVPDIALLGQPLGAVVPPAHRRQRLPDAAHLNVTDAAGAVLAKAARSAEAMTGRGTLDVERAGVRLRAGAIVEVHGAATPFDGLYEVSRVRDTITSDSHSQMFELLRAGIGAVTPR